MMLATDGAVGSRNPDRTVSFVDSTVCVAGIRLSSLLVGQVPFGHQLLLVSQGGAEELAALGGSGLSRAGVAERLDHDEVVARAVVVEGRDRDSGGAQAGGVGFGLVLSTSASTMMTSAGGRPVRSSRVARSGAAVTSARWAGSVVYWSRNHWMGASNGILG
jgi:hypothetical protein